MAPVLLVLQLALICFSASSANEDPLGPLSRDFQKYLSSKNLDYHDFVREDYGQNGSFGGRTHPEEITNQIPVIFIHGNSDSALWTNEFSSGWENSIKVFLENGYQMGELFGTSWGNTVTTDAVYRCKEVRRLRAFLKAVLEYTGSARVSVVTHSMGTTLMRKAIQGGRLEGPNGDSCKIGRSLAHKVDVFIGISSANAGLCWCAGAGALFPTCNSLSGFYVSTECGGEPATVCSRHSCPAQRSELLVHLDAKDARKVFSIWSTADELIGGGGMVWGRQTSFVPHSDGVKIFPNLTHMKTKEESAGIQFEMVAGLY